jgi:hypothetical protein
MKNTSSMKSGGKDAVDRLIDLAFGSDALISKMSAGELSAHLRSSGTNTDQGWDELQEGLKIAEGKARLAAARMKRQNRPLGDALAVSLHETKEAIIEQIKGLISLTGGSAVYARKWEESSVDDLRSLRDELVRTTGRAAKKKLDEQ